MYGACDVSVLCGCGVYVYGMSVYGVRRCCVDMVCVWCVYGACGACVVWMQCMYVWYVCVWYVYGVCVP